MKPATLAASVLLAIVSILQLVRVLAGVNVAIGGTVLPMWPSVVAFLVAGTLSIMLWREARAR